MARDNTATPKAVVFLKDAIVGVVGPGLVHKVVASVLIAVELGTADVAYCPGKVAAVDAHGKMVAVIAMAIVFGMAASA